MLQLPLSPHSCPPPLMGIFRPCPKSNFRHLDFPCFRLAPGQDLIWFESTTLGFQIHSKEFPTRFQKCRGVPALITPITFTSLSCTRRWHEEKVSWCTERQACSLMSCAVRPAGDRQPAHGAQLSKSTNATRSRKCLCDPVGQSCSHLLDLPRHKASGSRCESSFYSFSSSLRVYLHYLPKRRSESEG